MLSSNTSCSTQSLDSDSKKVSNDYSNYQRDDTPIFQTPEQSRFSAHTSTQKIVEPYYDNIHNTQQSDHTRRPYQAVRHGAIIGNPEGPFRNRNLSLIQPAASHFFTEDYNFANEDHIIQRVVPNELVLEGSSTPTASTITEPVARSTSSTRTSKPSSIRSKAQPRRPRREKAHLELAPDQPPTTQGNPRERVYVACVQCRSRKIRCDGAKPTCHNCSHRNADCSYDSAPKRRGPDKNPGARQRISRSGEVGEVGPIRRRRRRSIVTLPTFERVSGDKKPLVPEELERRELSASSSSGSVMYPSYRAIHNNSENSPEQLVMLLVYCGTLIRRSLWTVIFREINHSPIRQVNRSPFSKSRSVLTLTQKLSPFRSSQHPALEYLPLYAPYLTGSASSQIQELSELEEEDRAKSVITPEPSLNFLRKTWWDSLLSLYTFSSARHLSLTSAQRGSASQGVISDLRFLFRCSNYWFTFFHVPSFLGRFFDRSQRENIQPSLILAALAVSTFFQSSDVEKGIFGREKAFRLRENAQSAFEASFNGGWIDETLVHAAWLLAFFEVCAHPHHSTKRSRSAMLMLDSLIRSLSLISMDADDPQVSMFSPRTVPIVLRDLPGVDDQSPAQHQHSNSVLNPSAARGGSAAERCSCQSLTLGDNWSQTSEVAPLWTATPAWNDQWTEGELRKEACRRVCWSAMILVAGHNAYASANQLDSLNLFIGNPANYSILFSGESLRRSSVRSPKDTIWALYDRAIMLWNGCVRMRGDHDASDVEKSQFGLSAWLEADALETALNKHTCGIERAFMFLGREYLFNTRMVISHEFRRWIPLVTADVSGLFHRFKAEEWLSHQAVVAERLMMGLHAVTGHSTNILARRPFFVFWLMGQTSRALTLWECDNTLLLALKVCKAFLPPIDYLTALWPCKEQRVRYGCLRNQINTACYSAGLPLPPSPNLTLPNPSQSGQLL